MSNCIEIYNISDMQELINDKLNLYLDVNLFTCGVFILASLSNICIYNSIKKTLINHCENIVNKPPEYT